MQMTWKAWLSGLLAAAIAGVADGVILHFAVPNVFTLTREGFTLLGQVLVVSTLVKAAFWAKSHAAPGALPNGEGK